MKTIFLDMDGVVADFDRYAWQLLGIRPQGAVYPDDQWTKLAENPRLYRDLKVCDDADFLVDSVLELAQANRAEVLFLTAVPKSNDMPWAFYDKVIWAAEHFPKIPVWFGPYSKDKHVRATQESLLIDDRAINIQQWQDAGGLGILHRDAQTTVARLQDIFKNMHRSSIG